MTVRALDPVTKDIVTSGVQFLSKREEIAQTISTRLRLFLGEYFRNINDGTPWFESILGKTGTNTNRDNAIKQRIAQTDDVVQLLSFSADFNIDTRAYSVQSEVLTTFGQIQFTISETF